MERERDVRLGFRRERGGGVYPVERNPARQKSSQNCGPRNGASKSVERFVEHRCTKVEPLAEGASVQTFLFRNFPDDCLDKELIAKFQEAAVVVDLFCPKKRDVFGKRFGFVRIKLGCEDREETLLEKLNSLWMGSYKIRVFTPRYERRGTNQGRANMKSAKEIGQRSPIPGRGALVEQGLSFVNVTAGGPNPKEEKEEALAKKVCFSPSEKEKEWLKSAKIGLLRENFSWEEFGPDIQKEVDPFISLKYMGDDLVLYMEKEAGAISEACRKEWENEWFTWTRAWKPEDVGRRREFWTEWYGVPLHAWSERFFRQACLCFGSFVELDVNSRERTRLDVARVKVRGRALKSINESIIVEIDGKEFSVTIVEVRPMVEASWEGDSDSESAFSETTPGKDLWAREKSEEEYESIAGEDPYIPETEARGAEAEALQKREVKVGENEVLGCVKVDATYGEERKDAVDGGFGVGESNINDDAAGDGNKRAEADESLEFPPGWGPEERPADQDGFVVSGPPVGLAQENGLFGQAQSASDSSLDVPPGWGPKIQNVFKGDGLSTDQAQDVILEKGDSSGEGERVSETCQETFREEEASEIQLIPQKETHSEGNTRGAPSKPEWGRDKKTRSPRLSKNQKKRLKRAEKRKEEDKTRSFFQDLDSPGKIARLREEERKRVEIEGVKKLGESLGLIQAVPNASLEQNIEASLFDGKMKQIESRGGVNNVCP